MTKTTDTAYKNAVYLAIELANARGTLDDLATVRAYKKAPSPSPRSATPPATASSA